MWNIRESVMVALGLSLILLITGCHLFPSRPFFGEYIVNRSGHYYMGHRCVSDLVEIGVFLEDSYPEERDSVVYDIAIWHAVSAPSMVREFELFATDQPGVTVISDDGSRSYSTKIDIVMLDSRGHWLGMLATLDTVEKGYVYSPDFPRITWEEYWNMPDRDFGC